MNKIKKFQEPLFALGGFGTTFLFTVQSTYLLTRYMPSERDLGAGIAILLVLPVLLSIVMLIARVIDGFIDIPIAAIADKYFARHNSRRGLIGFGILPLLASFILMWLPPFPAEQNVLNLVWLAFFSILFFITYTFVTVPYLSSLSDIVSDKQSRIRVASWQAFFNTIGYSLAYTVIPILRDVFSDDSATSLQNGITKTALILSPLILTMFIPVLFVFRKSSEPRVEEPKGVGLVESLKTTLQNKRFRHYLLVYSFSFFGLQLFLGGMDYMHRSMMGLSGWQIAVVNTAAFAPVPIMLFIFNKINKKYGVATAMRVALVCFMIAMSIFTLAYTGFVGTKIPLYLGLAASTFGSFAIGAFFTIPYAMPAQLAAEETQLTGVNRAGMYFAVQGLVNQITAAIAGSLVLINVLTIKVGIIADGAVFIGPIVIVACIISFIFAKNWKTDFDGKK